MCEENIVVADCVVVAETVHRFDICEIQTQPYTNSPDDIAFPPSKTSVPSYRDPQAGPFPTLPRHLGQKAVPVRQRCLCQCVYSTATETILTLENVRHVHKRSAPVTRQPAVWPRYGATARSATSLRRAGHTSINRSWTIKLHGSKDITSYVPKKLLVSLCCQQTRGAAKE